MWTHLPSVAMALALFAAPHELCAQNAPPNLESLQAAGVALRAQDRPEAALRIFQLAYDLHNESMTLARIALAEIALRRFVDAEEHLQRALDDYPDPWITAHQQDLTAALTEVRRQLGTVEITCNVSGAELWINGARYRTLSFRSGSQRIRVLTGQLRAEIRSEGYAPQQWDIEVPAGATRDDVGARIHATLQPLPPPPERSGTVPSGSRAGAWVLMGVGAAALGTSAILHFALRSDAVERFDNLCRGGICAPEAYPAGQAALDEAGTFATLGDVFFGVGVASVVGGFTWWLASRPSSPRTPERTAVHMVPNLRGDGASLQVSGSF